MTVFEAISLMISFGIFILTLLAYIDRNNKRK
ncbi:putative holin-like toxin [[Clostridium] scindens]|nr:putative holin-like toxin [[Clostridium] scindens]MDY4867948.1 putative holin-like toxin [[Clostridium] scindens]